MQYLTTCERTAKKLCSLCLHTTLGKRPTNIAVLYGRTPNDNSCPQSSEVEEDN